MEDRNFHDVWRSIAVGLIMLLVAAAPAHAGWLVAETKHFRLYSKGSRDALVKSAAQLEDFHALLVEVTGRDLRPGAPPLEVVNVDVLADALPYASVPHSVAGFYRASEGGIIAFAEMGRQLMNGQEILFHEYAHHFMLGVGGAAYPAWYVEGFAEYFAPSLFRPGWVEFGRLSANRLSWLKRPQWLPLETVLGWRPKEEATGNPQLYAQSWLLTHYLMRTPAMREKWLAYLKDVAGGGHPVESFRRHVDSDLVRFQGRLRDYLASAQLTYSRYERSPVEPAAIKVHEMPPSADRLLLPMMAIQQGLLPSQHSRILTDIRRLAGEIGPNDVMAAHALALAELRLGDRRRAQEILEQLVAQNPDHPVLLRWLAEALAPEDRSVSLADVDRAKSLLTRSIRVDPRDWRTLYVYVRLHPQPLTPDVLQMMLRTWELAPQVGGVVMNTAIALALVGRMDDASTVLEPLANAPHGGQTSALAANLLAAARIKDIKAFMTTLNRLPPSEAAAAVQR